MSNNNKAFKPYTVVVTCGPSGIGKSYTVKTLLKQIDEFNAKRASLEPTLKTLYLSSDDLRYELLQQTPATLDKFDSQMSAVSEQAFKLLETKLLTNITYPVNTHLIFVDSTALNKEWRKKLIDLCRKHHYNIDLLLFDFDNRKDFYTYSTNKVVTEKGIQRFYESVLPDLERHEYNNVIRVRTREDISAYDDTNIIEPTSYETLKEMFVKSQEAVSADRLYVIGDVHGCYFTLKTLIEKELKCSIDENNNIVLADANQTPTTKFILAGDLIDKGFYSKEVLDLVVKNASYFITLQGNHDHLVYNYLTTDSVQVPEEILSTYFTSIDQYINDVNDEEFKNLLLQVRTNSVTSLHTPYFEVTHAPCETKYLGKISTKAFSKQRNFALPTRGNRNSDELKEVWEDSLKFLKEESSHNLAPHFFGHVCTTKPFRVKNKYSVDSGAVSGNGLSYYELKKHAAGFCRGKLLTVATDPRDIVDNYKPEVYTLFNSSVVDAHALEPRLQNRIKWLCADKVNYISGTMSPSNSLVAEDGFVNIESLQAGLEYYKQKGVSKVILQPKYMGSRCNVYLQPKISDCYMVSRNGYKIKHLYKEKGAIDNFRAFFYKLKDSPLVQQLYKDYPDLETIILDGELLPWFALGKPLIEKIYDPLHSVIHAELQELQTEHFPHHLQQVLTKQATGIPAASEREERTFRTLAKLALDGVLIDSKDALDSLKTSCKEFHRQVELFARTGNIEFKPFSILKLVMKDGSEILPNYAESWLTIANTEKVDYVIEDLTRDTLFSNSVTFFDKVEAQGLEGVVIKPLLEDLSYIEQKQIAPYLKVRNKQYLRLVYGYDYLENKQKHLKLSVAKNISKKVKVSINEFLIGQKLLQTPYQDINETNTKYKNLLATMIVEEEAEKFLDPRL